MCLGIPGKIVEITDAHAMLAKVEISGIKREINIACVIDTAVDKKNIVNQQTLVNQLLDKWVLVHVGFAMCIIDESQAKETLSALESMQALQHELNDFSAIGQVTEES
ncbi:HypC/HybG/HupF family hydrogenase formation chaperone [Vibrio sp. MA40-2]|uniref:HypC/HybG/HupF family hydrogenase formation chaperone n=1 Tax=Vibrio sp. MA40-2 TaxID=3391828 RepID=UPI0039A45642